MQFHTAVVADAGHRTAHLSLLEQQMANVRQQEASRVTTELTKLEEYKNREITVENTIKVVTRSLTWLISPEFGLFVDSILCARRFALWLDSSQQDRFTKLALLIQEGYSFEGALEKEQREQQEQNDIRSYNSPEDGLSAEDFFKKWGYYPPILDHSYD